jgi:thiamine phosphate synthase YjbQ (UPF0047 family)
MITVRKELWFNIPTHRTFINITPAEDCLRESGVREGMVLVNTSSSTSAGPYLGGRTW